MKALLLATAVGIASLFLTGSAEAQRGGGRGGGGVRVGGGGGARIGGGSVGAVRVGGANFSGVRAGNYSGVAAINNGNVAAGFAFARSGLHDVVPAGSLGWVECGETHLGPSPGTPCERKPIEACRERGL